MIRVLQSRQEINISLEKLKQRKLDFSDPRRLFFWRMVFELRYLSRFPVPDKVKSWDVINSLELIESIIKDKQSPILDMGCFNSQILYVLNYLGYRSLYGCDLDKQCKFMPFWRRIHYRVADITATGYADNYFAAITCISVIEHGVSVERLAKELRRILRPQGLFIFTVDYNTTAQRHDCNSNFRPFGKEWVIFDRERLYELIGQFEKNGLSLLKPDEITEIHKQCPIQWGGENYTIAFVAMKAA